VSSVHFQCPHCRGVCQVQPHQFGTAVKCAQCGRPFGLPAAPPASAARPAASAPAPAPAPAVATAPPATTPEPTPSASAERQEVVTQEVDASLGSGIWRGLQSLYKAIKGSVHSAPAPAAPADRPPSDDDIRIELDGPTAAALAAGGPGGLKEPPSPGVCRLDIGSATSPGRVRTRNEDSHVIVQLTCANLDQRRDAALIVLADGMGGYDAGDQASALTIRTVGSTLLAQLVPALAVQGQEKPPPGAAEAVRAAIKSANRTVLERAQTAPGCKGMGATAAVVLIWEGQVQVGHVGDCRVYHHSAGLLRQVTKDQTLVARMVEMGKLTPEEALTHPNRNEVTQAVGRSSDIQPASYEFTAGPGDWLIVACDGLHAHVDERALANAVRNAGSSAAGLAQQLVDLANQGGGTDNTTVVAVRCY
jgi:PPM family protein phosphatase